MCACKWDGLREAERSKCKQSKQWRHLRVGIPLTYIIFFSSGEKAFQVGKILERREGVKKKEIQESREGSPIYCKERSVRSKSQEKYYTKHQ